MSPSTPVLASRGRGTSRVNSLNTLEESSPFDGRKELRVGPGTTCTKKRPDSPTLQTPRAPRRRVGSEPPVLELWSTEVTSYGPNLVRMGSNDCVLSTDLTVQLLWCTIVGVGSRDTYLSGHGDKDGAGSSSTRVFLSVRLSCLS